MGPLWGSYGAAIGPLWGGYGAVLGPPQQLWFAAALPAADEMQRLEQQAALLSSEAARDGGGKQSLRFVRWGPP